MKNSLAYKVGLFSTVITASFALSIPGTISEAFAEAPAYYVSLPDFSKLVEDNGKTVVSIDSVRKAKKITPRGDKSPKRDFDPFEEFRRFGFPFPFPFDPDSPRSMPERRGQGSGFIIDPDGLIMTNHHVVDGADELTVHLHDKREFKAKVLGSDAKTDIAVIKIDAKGLPAAKLGKSEKVKVGEWVAAIGAPFGLDNTVTQGIVSAVSRNLPDDQFVPFIQTDVAVNPGNSGGPLFNMNGEVIGINSQIFSTSGGFMGLSFAIPIDLAVQIKDQLIKEGKVSRGKIGVVMQPLTKELADSFGLKDTNGALVVQLEEKGPAEKAGLKEGDIITEFNGTKIKEAGDLSRVVAATKPGSKASITVIRDGSEKTLSIKIDEMGPNGLNLSSSKSSDPATEESLGVITRPLTDKEKQKLRGGGLYVQSVSGPAQEAGMRVGDIIIRAAGKSVASPDDLKNALKGAKDTVAVLVDRNGRRVFIPVKLSKKKD